MGLTKPIEQYLCSNLLNLDTYILYLKDIIRGETSMISVFQETWDEGEAHGLAEGKAETIVEMGYEFGLSEEDILTRLQNKLNIPLQKAEEYLKMFGRQPA